MTRMVDNKVGTLTLAREYLVEIWITFSLTSGTVSFYYVKNKQYNYKSEQLTFWRIYYSFSLQA